MVEYQQFLLFELNLNLPPPPPPLICPSFCPHQSGKILEYTDPSVVFVFMMAFTMSTISLCFLISVFFSKANLAAVCGGFIYFVTYLPYTQLVQWDDEITTSQKLLAVSLPWRNASNLGFVLFFTFVFFLFKK